ncbi:hypothetical protein M427DRAFT_73407 [Gonapodya prolifera JEL478]|uniref:Uncharacterized protein n=1 Tax=Gonapodya prolifera (strain JEL478) TaxID=1344416 RepID=A0A139A342_GONPJ|nr:hypothetical protein M427DRAFT_73407 [Gonapodya prolifera JEL478]|eukprot:KXS10945.1 hypothetical protein M427DRAFT_73407 [Gonapodya prolifera JEL478]
MATESSSESRRFRLLDLPSAVIGRIGTFATSHRLAFPTGALNQYLKSIFAHPVNITARAVAHYPSPEHSLVKESSKGDVEIGRVLATKADVNALAMINDSKHSALAEAVQYGHLKPRGVCWTQVQT